MLILQGVSYAHPNKEQLFTDIDLVINKHDKIALIGNNGTGKSTLLKILAGALQPSKGAIKAGSKPYYLPQTIGQFENKTIAEALSIDKKLNALNAILNGEATEENMTLIGDDWSLQERCHEAFAAWNLGDIALTQKMATLSGGQKIKVFLAGILIHRPEIVLLDEPSNHLDKETRKKLYEYISLARETLVVVSHDRTLLNLLETVFELDKHGITAYGGNYDFYEEQKRIAGQALKQQVREHEKTLRKARDTARETQERRQKLEARGKKKQEKAGLPTISMNTFRNNAEKSSARLKDAHGEKLESLSKDLDNLRNALPETNKMRLDFDNAALHKGKKLVTIIDANFAYDDRFMWTRGLNLEIFSGDRLAIHGANGSGKTTLIKMILAELPPTKGTIETTQPNIIYIDQDYSLLSSSRSVYEQAQTFNTGNLHEHEIGNRLTRFLFPKDSWSRPCTALSGGERMRLSLCCLNIGTQAPDMIILDEPTNNLDIENITVLTTAIGEYQGTLIVVSHDEYFLREIGIERDLLL